MSNLAVHFSSKTVLHSTPQDLYERLHRLYAFDLDVCAIPSNAKCARYFTPEMDALKQRWDGRCWMNPPYGEPEFPCKPRCAKKRCARRGWHTDKYIAGVSDFVEKAVIQVHARIAPFVVGLLPARTDTAWFHEFIWDAPRERPRPGVRVDFLRGRLVFGNATASAPFPSMLVEFRKAE